DRIHVQRIDQPLPCTVAAPVAAPGKVRWERETGGNALDLDPVRLRAVRGSAAGRMPLDHGFAPLPCRMKRERQRRKGGWEARPPKRFGWSSVGHLLPRR